LAHELAHVVQQGGARASAPMEAPADHDAVEHDADAAAVAAVLSLWMPQGAPGRAERESAVPRLRSGLQLRRCGPQQKPPESAATAAHSPSSAPSTKGACLPVVVNPTWDVAPRPITAGKGRCDLQLMKALVTPSSGFGLNGMEFKGTLSMPATCPGKAYFVQYVKPSRKSVGCFDSKEEGFCATPSLGLDTAWPYPEGSVVNTDQDPGTSVPFNTVDSPGHKNISRPDLGLVRICIEDSFTTYLVFEDNAGALTSLGWMSWSYTAHAVRDGGKCPATTTTPDCAGWTVTGTGTKGSSDFTVGASAPQQALDRSVGAVNLMPSDCGPDGCPK
jgi:hypothetical protein